MASEPKKGDRLIAKVRLTFYMNDQCTVPFPPVPPGVGYKSTFQVMERKEDQEVGTYTGKSSNVGFEVDWVQQYRKVPAWPNKPFDVIIPRTSWVKRDQVTGFWDMGVDSPVNDPDNVLNTPAPTEPDQTNTYLFMALGAAAFWKFLLPKIKEQ